MSCFKAATYERILENLEKESAFECHDFDQCEKNPNIFRLLPFTKQDKIFLFNGRFEKGEIQVMFDELIIIISYNEIRRAIKNRASA